MRISRRNWRGRGKEGEWDGRSEWSIHRTGVVSWISDGVVFWVETHGMLAEEEDDYPRRIMMCPYAYNQTLSLI